MATCVALALFSGWLFLDPTPDRQPVCLPGAGETHEEPARPTKTELLEIQQVKRREVTDSLPDEVAKQQALADQGPEPDARCLRTEYYKGGATKRSFDTVVEHEFQMIGEVVMFAASKRPGRPTVLLLEYLTGSIPPLGTELELIDSRSCVVCRCKVLRQYHYDDNEDLPIESLGCEAIDDVPSAPVTKGLRARLNKPIQIRNGAYFSWYESGKRACTGQYEMGRRIGRWTYWHRNGQIRASGEFEDDVPVELWEFWRSDGSLEARFAPSSPSSDRWQAFHADGTTDPRPQLLHCIELVRNGIIARNYATALRHVAESRLLARNLKDSELQRELGLMLDELDERIEAIKMGEHSGKDPSLIRTLRSALELAGLPSPTLPPPEFQPAPTDDALYITPMRGLGRDPNHP